MKPYYLRLSFLFLFISCTVDKPDSQPEFQRSIDGVQADITVNASHYTDTKTSFESFAFEAGDTVGLLPVPVSPSIPEHTSQLPLIYYGSSSSSAHFCSGLGWSMMIDGNYKYVAYYPYQENANASGVVLDYSNQMQTGNGNNSHIWDYDFLYSDAVFPTSSTDASFEMSHFSALSKFTITVPEDYSSSKFSSFALVADSAVFVKKGVVDVSSISTSGKPFFTPESYTKVINMNLKGVTPNNKEVTVYMMMAPAELQNDYLSVKLFTITGKCLRAKIKCEENQQGGERYDYSLSVAAATTPVYLPDKPSDGETLDILLVGHSLGVDATEYLPALLNAAGITNVNIGRFYYANGSLETHYSCYVDETPYAYYYCSGGNSKYSVVYRTLKSVIQERCWDLVVFQQSVGNEGAGTYSTYQPYLNNLISLVRDESISRYGIIPFFGWHMHWAFNTGTSYESMLTKIKNATKSMMTETGIEIIVPSATAIDNGRKTSLYDFSGEIPGDSWCHCSRGVGRYLGACTWFESIIKPIYGVSVVGNTFRMLEKMTGESDAPDSRAFYPVNDTKAPILQRCAAAAAEKPFETTVITE